jgi:hypothetical protein
MRRLFCFPLLVSSLVGCPQVEPSVPPPTECTKLFDRCQLPEGPLGVCEQKSIDDATLVCNSQH